MNKRLNATNKTLDTLGHLEFLKNELFKDSPTRQAWISIMIRNLSEVLQYLREG